MTISLTDDAKKHSVASIRRYFAEELELDVGELKAGLVLDFIVKEIGPSIYNAAIADAQAFLRERLVDMEALSAPEFAHWPRNAVRRGSPSGNRSK
ncbi:MAG TPA: DUF2164 domain-containing protein [Gemmatimonadaceae bacterium]|jgi:uncharacterized protein (DUF2164 family)